MYKQVYKEKIAEGNVNYPEGTVLDETEDEADTQNYTQNSNVSGSGVYLSKRTDTVEDGESEEEHMEEQPTKPQWRLPTLKTARSESKQLKGEFQEDVSTGKQYLELGLKKQSSSGGPSTQSTVRETSAPRSSNPTPTEANASDNGAGGWFKDSSLSDAEQKRLFKLMGGKSKEDFEKLNQKSAAVEYSKLNQDLEERFQKGLQLKRGGFKGLGRN